MLTSDSRDTPTAVLDTNTTLACWWFDDAAAAGLREALESRRLRWLATAAMREELCFVLARPLPVPRTATDTPDARVSRVLDAFDRYSLPASPAHGVHRLWCTDRSDQIFIDLAVGHGARWLFSRDRAVLKLRRRAAAGGLHILSPDDWRLPAPDIAGA